MREKEIPHNWFYHDKPCIFLSPIVDVVQRKVVGATILQEGGIIRIDVVDGEFPGLTYELVQ